MKPGKNNLSFEFITEKEFHDYIVDNFSTFFEFPYMCSEYKIGNKNKIGIIVAPKFSSNIDLKKYDYKILLKKIEDVKCLIGERITLRIPGSLYSKLRKISYETRVSINTILLNFIKEGIKEGK